MMQSLGSDDEWPVEEMETEEQQLRRRVDELERQLTQHLNAVNNPHQTTAEQVGAVSTYQMWNLLDQQMKFHEEAARWLIAASGLGLVFTACVAIHFATESTRDWPLLVASFLTVVCTYAGFSTRANSHRTRAADCRAQRDKLPTPHRGMHS